MRNAFAAELTALVKDDPRIVLLSGDIGNRLFDNFKALAPDRFFNCGAAEANMIGVAAGLAMNGFRPIAYTITPFVTSRCYEQIKVDVSYHNLPVIIVGTGSGLSYASLGATHHSLEDIAIMRVLPHVAVVCPADGHEVRAALKEALDYNGPVYLRIGKKGEPAVHSATPQLKIGKAIVMRDGKDVCLLSAGNTLPLAFKVADELVSAGLTSRVVSFHTVKPLDQEMLKEVSARFPVVATLEEHSLAGGFGSAVSEWINDNGFFPGRLLRFGARDEFLHESGSQEYARAKYGLTVEEISAAIRSALS